MALHGIITAPDPQPSALDGAEVPWRGGGTRERLGSAVLAGLLATGFLAALWTWGPRDIASRTGGETITIRLLTGAQPRVPSTSRKLDPDRSIPSAQLPAIDLPESRGPSEDAIGGSPSAPTHSHEAAREIAPPGPTSPGVLDLALSAEQLRTATGIGHHSRSQLTSLAKPTAEQRFSRSMQAAQTPDCLSTEALRHAPPEVLGVGVRGLLVIPTWIEAGAKGKCAMP